MHESWTARILAVANCGHAHEPKTISIWPPGEESFPRGAARQVLAPPWNRLAFARLSFLRARCETIPRVGPNGQSGFGSRTSIAFHDAISTSNAAGAENRSNKMVVLPASQLLA
jgi:hypothetical protein